ncbi:MAG: glycosyltransferase family 4 protein [Bacteroidia bacterium]
MKRVLIITYYWPPSGGNGVQRWVKFAKYLRDFNWEPVVFTVSNGEYPVLDHSLVKDIPEGIEVIKHQIWEPYFLYKKFTGKKSDSKINRDVVGKNRKLSFTEKTALWLRGNIFIPDARKFWIKPSVKFLCNYLQSNPVDAIISTGPPHTDHLIALGIKKKLNIKWIADFRDPWTTMDYFNDLRLSSFAFKKHHRLELEVLRTADKVISVGSMMKKEFDEKRKSRTEIITNGFDREDFVTDEVNLSGEFSIVHIGSFLERRNPVSLWKALRELISENTELKNKIKIKLIGRVEQSIFYSLKEYNLESYVESIPYMDHQKVIKEMKRSQVLLLPIDDFDGAKWVLTGKLFEYLAAKRPILCIGPQDGDAALVLAATKAGNTFDFDDVAGIKKQLLEYFNLYLQNKLQVNSSSIDNYSRKRLTQKLAGILNEITA